MKIKKNKLINVKLIQVIKLWEGKWLDKLILYWRYKILEKQMKLKHLIQQ